VNVSASVLYCPVMMDGRVAAPWTSNCPYQFSWRFSTARVAVEWTTDVGVDVLGRMRVWVCVPLS
jgi:hypothetical protein